MDREDHSSSGGMCSDADNVDRDLPEQYLRRVHGDPVLPHRSDRNSQFSLWAGLRAIVLEGDHCRIRDLHDSACRELADREDCTPPLSGR